MFGGLEACASMNQFNKYEDLSYGLAKNDKEYMEEKTSCMYPCEYIEYKV